MPYMAKGKFMEIKGLKKFHKTALKNRLIEKDIKAGDFEIEFKQSISLKQLHCLWYGGGVVDIKYKNYIFHIEAIGDVIGDLYSKNGDEWLCRFKDKRNGGCFCDFVRPYFNTDKELNSAKDGEHRLYRLQVDYNNWWECLVEDPQGKIHDLMWNLDNDDLFDAIGEVLGILDEMIDYVKEDAA
jgi:ABC-type cobalt transport system substrate-binding protein